jgi:hypothetical protein
LWNKESLFKDSIIVEKDSIIVLQRGFIQYTDTLITTYDLKLKESEENLKIMTEKRKNAFIIGGVSTIASFFIGFFIKP